MIAAQSLAFRVPVRPRIFRASGNSGISFGVYPVGLVRKARREICQFPAKVCSRLFSCRTESVNIVLTWGLAFSSARGSGSVDTVNVTFRVPRAVREKRVFDGK